jgi:outer membrane protein TolC
MNTMKKILFVLSLLLPLAGSAQTLPDSLALMEFLALAEERAIGRQQAETDLEIAELNYSLFQASQRPQLSATANFPNYSRTVSEIIQPDGTVRFQPIRNNNSALGLQLSQQIAATGGTVFVQSNLQRFDNFESKDQLYNGIPVRVGIAQPLFGFNAQKWAQRLEPLRLTEAQKQYRADRAAIHTEATRLFFNYLYARMEMDIAIANQQSNQELYDIAEERHALGKLSDSDLMQLRVNLLSAQRSRRNAEQNYRDRAAFLRTYLGLSPNAELPYPVQPESPPALSISEEEALQQAINNRPELDRYRRQQLEAEQEVARAKGEGGFQADLVASMGWTRSAQDLEQIYRSPQQEQLLQVQVSVPILDWGAQRNRVALQKASLALQQRQAKQDELDFRTDIRQTLQQLQNLQQEVELAQELMQLARKRFQIAEESYRLGGIDITNLIISQQEKDLSTRTYVFALGDYWQTYYQLKAFTLSNI